MLKRCILIFAEEEQLDQIDQGNKRETTDNLDVDDRNIGAGTNVSRLRQRFQFLSKNINNNSKEPGENFRIFFHVMEEDHSLPDLIWNKDTRQELKEALEIELKSIDEVTKTNGGIEKVAWNYQQFRVEYLCLKSEVKVGSIYMRLWLQTGDSFIKSWDNPIRLFELLFRRLLCDMDHDNLVTNMCIRCLERLYKIHGKKIGVFPDIMIVVRLMGNTKCIETRHRLLSLIATLIGCSNDIGDDILNHWVGNAEQLLSDQCISYLCQFVAMEHFHSTKIESGLGTTHGYVSSFQSNTKESLESKNDVCVEQQNSSIVHFLSLWLVAPPGNNQPSQDKIMGPMHVQQLSLLIDKGDVLPTSLVTTISVDEYHTDLQLSSDLKEMCSNQGKWEMLQNVLQLRWQLLTDHSSPAVYSSSEVALLALKCLNRIVGIHKSVDSRGIPFYPIPFSKRLICEVNPTHSLQVDTQSSRFHHDSLAIICQALLCNDSLVVKAAVNLIINLMNHNRKACSKLYLTGVFFFALISSESDFEPIAQLINKTHMTQNSSFDESSTDDCSILDTMLPKGLVNVLRNEGVEKFCDIFCGDCDTPEGKFILS